MIHEDEPVTASVDGIRQCLRLLAEEAAVLKLSGTIAAIESALAMIEVEVDGAPVPVTPKGPARYMGMLLH